MFQIIAKHCANNASHTMHRTPLVWRGLDESVQKVGPGQSRYRAALASKLGQIKMKRNTRTNNSAFAPYSQSGRTTFEAAIKSVIFKFQSQHWLVKRQMRQFQNLTFNDFFNLVESQSGLIQLRSDSYRAGLKYRSGPWCNPSLLSAQTLVVSDKHPSIQKTICHVCCPDFYI